MKKFLPLLITIISLNLNAQITSPVVRAGFGVDADLRNNYVNSFLQTGNDDWFHYPSGATGPGAGQGVIDTTGAAAMMNRFASDPAFRRLPFFRTMRLPQFTVVNNRLWIDAVYIRDYNGQAGGDSTAFVTSNKNGDNPAVWDGGITSVLDKNDIADMYVHVRRQGPTRSDSLWFIGGLSLQGTTGNRYFDFELYQTDIFYNRSTGAFTNYGPDAGHTSWKFDAAGRIITPGDVIFTAEYSSSSLTMLEARVWINRASLNITPVDFDWTGTFDGADAGATFGYAGIRPKVAGTYYTGLQSSNGAWAGSFGFIDGGNNLQTTYTARQFMEFSVNLSKLGLDPLTLLMGGGCGLPFRRILVKTRSSTAFTAELKDFIGPFDFFVAPPVQARADVPIFCGAMSVSQICVENPLGASVYRWSTTDGHIVYDSVGTCITVDRPGRYIVSQTLLDGCAAYAYDTIDIQYYSDCSVLQNNSLQFRGTIQKELAQLNWSTTNNHHTEYFEVERSLDGRDFQVVGRRYAAASDSYQVSYSFAENISGIDNLYVIYRLKVRHKDGSTQYSRPLRLSLPNHFRDLQVYPNPAKDQLFLAFPAGEKGGVKVSVYSVSGNLISARQYQLVENTVLTVGQLRGLNNGTYMMQVVTDKQTYWKKFLVSGAVK